MNTALLNIDMQRGSFTAATPRFDREGVTERMNALAEAFRADKLPVVFIQHDGTNHGEYIPGNEDWKLLPELIVEKQDIQIDKYANDVFYRSELLSTLNKLEVKDLIITGCATDFCVEATVQSALAKDFNVTVIADAHTTGDRPHLKAEQVIEHYNWVWQNMIPTEGTLKVQSTATFLKNRKQGL